MEASIRCAYCREMIPEEAGTCPHCGAPVEHGFEPGDRRSPPMPGDKAIFPGETSPYAMPGLDLGYDVLPGDKGIRALTLAIAALMVFFFPVFGILIAGAALASSTSARKELPRDRKSLSALVISAAALLASLAVNVFLFANTAAW